MEYQFNQSKLKRQIISSSLSLALLCATSSSFAGPGDPVVFDEASCEITPTGITFPVVGFLGAASFPIINTNFLFSGSFSSGTGFLGDFFDFQTFSDTPFTTDTTVPASIADISAEQAPASLNTPITRYLLLGSDLNDNVCSISYTLTFDGTDYTRSAYAFAPLAAPLPPASPESIPIFTPLGLVATIGGLLWFGRRRKSIKIS